MLISLGVRKAPLTSRVAREPADNDFVARYGLSYGEAADPISKEARLEVERLKSIKPPRK